ncbi:unnamed protein product [Rhizopus stolonifer]
MNCNMTSLINNIMQFNTLPLPDKEIEQIFNSQGSLSIEEVLGIFHDIIQKSSSWLESVHLALFSLEQNLQEGMDEDLAPLETKVDQMAPIIHSLSDVNEIVLNTGAQESQTLFRVTKIQSEWSSLQHYLASVKQQQINNREQNDLVGQIERLLIQADDISIMMFDFQEKKHSPILSPSVSERDDVFSVHSDTSSFANLAGKEDSTMTEIDHAFETALKEIQVVFTRMSQLQPQELAKKRFEKFQNKWEQLQIEREEFKNEYKEDRWSTVFRRVSDQVDVMIDGLDRSVIQCQSFVQQIKSWYQQNKSLLRSYQPPTIPIDIEKFKSIEKSFEAKYKYYTPSIDRMLTILGNGIMSRGSRDFIIQERHESMMQRWYHLKEVTQEIRLRDLVEVERILSGCQQYSWKETRYRTPEPTLDSRSRTPMASLQPPPPSSLRGSISDSSSTSSLKSLRKTHTPRPTRNDSAQPKRDFYDEDERHYGSDFMKHQTRGRRTSPHSIDRPSTTQEMRPRSKTPNRRAPSAQSTVGFRSKSSMGDLRADRVMSPRSVTPSLIPRPRTPKEMSRATSPMIPPPVPPLPRYASESPLRKKQSMPILRHKPSIMEISVNETRAYRANPKDPLDVEVALIVNASPIAIQCQRAEQGKYYFGNEFSLSSMGGKKMYTCKLMTYANRKNGQTKDNKVLIRVGGGWQDLEFFLLEHSSLMTSDVVVRTYTASASADTSSRSKGWH